MLPTAIFWPMIVHVVLVLGLYPVLRIRRVRAVGLGQARPSDFRERTAGEPEASRTVLNNLANQFELPVLFHLGCLSLFVTGGVSFVVVVVAWIFAVSRYVHAFIHLGANRLLPRLSAFMIGLVATAFLWLWLALHLAALV